MSSMDVVGECQVANQQQFAYRIFITNLIQHLHLASCLCVDGH
jgi:hypothetical protein